MARDANKKLSLKRSERPEAHTQQKLAQVSPSPGPCLFPALSLSLPPLSERLKQAAQEIKTRKLSVLFTEAELGSLFCLPYLKFN